MKDKKIAFYLRVSSKEQANFGYSLDAQKEKCLQFLNLYDYGDCDYTIYMDDGYSAKNLNRPRMTELLNDVHDGKINMIVVYKLDRLARSVVDTYNLIQDLIEHDCQLVAVIDRLDIDSANGRMIVGILAVFAQWEREVIIERTRDGLDAMVAKGKYPYGGVPYGWNKDKKLFLSINEEQAKILNDLADQSLSGMSIVDIKDYLKETYGMSRDESTILKWLTRPINCGEFTFHEKLYTNIVPAIMSKQKFTKVCSSITRHASFDMSRYLYYNKVYCKCGKKCRNSSTNKRVGQNIRKYYYYECLECHARINETKVLEQTIMSIFLHHNRETLNASMKKKKDKLDNLRLKMRDVYTKYSNDEIDVLVYSDTIAKLKKEQDVLNNTIIALNIDDINDFKKASKFEKRAYINEIVKYVTVDTTLNLVIGIEWK